MRYTKNLLIGFSCLLIAACSTTGLDSSNKFKCNYRNGFEGCESISETYSNSINGSKTSDLVGANSSNRVTPYSGMPLRTPISVLRIWVAPWEDVDGDLRDQSFMYVALNESRWQIEHNQEAIVNEYRPTIRLLGSVDGKETEQRKLASDSELPDLGLTPSQNFDNPQNSLSSPPNLIPPPIK